MNKTITLLLMVVGLINFLPVLGVISAGNINHAYSVELGSNDLVILMRHRALLFGVIGGFILCSTFVRRYQVAAMVMAAVSMIGFLFILWSVGSYNALLFKVAIIDMVGIGLLIAAAVLKYASVRNYPD